MGWQDELQLPVDTWSPGSAFTELNIESQAALIMLCLQREMTSIGVVPMHWRYWALTASDMTVERAQSILARLEVDGWVISDDVVGEVWVPAYVDWFRIWDYPNRAIAAATDLRERVRSHSLRAAIREMAVPETVRSGWPDNLIGVSTSAASDLIKRGVATAPKPRRRQVSGNVRAMVYARDGLRCVECGVTERLTIDHIHPVSKGGTNDPINLQTLCHRCNSRKSDSTARA